MNLNWFGPLIAEIKKNAPAAPPPTKVGARPVLAAPKAVHPLASKLKISLNDELQRVIDLPDVDSADAPDYTDQLLLDPRKRHWKDGKEARLRPVQNQMLHAMAKAGGGFFLVSVGGGKCVREHCRVYDARRQEWREAGTLVGRSLTVSSLEESTRKMRRNSARGFASGIKPCVDVHLSSGAVLPVSADHQVFTADSGWVPAGCLYKGQPICASRQFGLPGVFAAGAAGMCVEFVTDVQHTGMHPVVDLSVDRDHNFLAEGVYIHNSFAALLAGSVIPGVERVLVFTPASTVNNLTAEMYRLRNLFRLCPVMDIRSTDELSRPRTEQEGDLLKELVFAKGGDPAKTLIVVDEAHRLKNVSSARGGRVLRFVLEYPQVRMVVMSGTMTSTSVKDCAHLSWYALRDGSPFPARWGRDADSDTKHNTLLEALSQCIDQKGKPEPGHWSQMYRLWIKYHPYMPEMWHVSGPERVSMMRRAFQARMRTAQGVVFTTGSSVPGLPLTLKGMKCDVPEEVTKAIKDLLNGVDPNGMPIPDDLSMQRIESQLGQGFYYVWDWPKDPAGKPKIDLDWKAAKSRWGKLVREEIKEHARTGYDSDMLVYNTCKNLLLRKCNNDAERAWVHWVSRTDKDTKIEEEGVDRAQFDHIWTTLQQRSGNNDLLQAWLSWSAIQKHKQEPPTKPVWISSFLVDHIVKWAKEQEHPPIIWYEHRAVGERLAQMGIPTFGAGTNPPGREILCALSRRAHGEGKNLQAWCNQVFLSPVPGAVAWEQTLGRTHRPDPSRDVKDRPPIVAYVCQHADVYVEALNKARQGATYIQDTTDNEQKLLYCAYEDIKLRKVTFATEEVLDEEEDEE